MTLRPTTIYADAWALWRADWHILTAVAGLFVFLPQYAAALLIPGLPKATGPAPTDINDPAFQAYLTQVQTWLQQYAPYYAVVLLIVMFGQFALVAVYLARRHATVGAALVQALILFPRLVLASIFILLPMALVGLLLVQLPLLAVPVSALVTARLLLIGPAILGARPIGAMPAVVRSFTLTRGNTLSLASVVVAILLAGTLIAIPFGLLDDWLLANGPNPVARMIVEAVVAVTEALLGVAMALVQVSVWRRLSSR